MEAHFEDDDRDTLASKTNAAPPRKMHSYSQQLRPSGAHKNQHCQYRKHSLDEERIAQNLEYLDDSSDEEFANFNSVNPSSAVVVPYTDLDAPFDHSLSINVDGTADPNDPNRGKPLPDFQAGGGTGIFKAPVRAAVHPSRPPAIELRPHPLRETQVGKFLRTIGCTESHLWAGQESGVRFWNIREMYEAGNGLGGRVRRGDEDAAPFYESGNTPPTLCMVVDEGSRVVWTGHKDGKIRSWKMEQILSDESVPFREGLSWQAHKGPIIAMVISSYGDLWSGSEGGVIKVWPWESIEKSLSLSSDEKRMAALLVERSAIDLRSQVTVNGVCNISSSDIKVMLADHTRGRVWCATSMSFSLWDARTRELVKVFNIEGQIENRADLQVASDQAVEDEMKIKFVSQSKKEKPQGFLQRSRNAIMGAADVVRRVASRSTGAFIEDNKKTEALVMTTDGMIWSGCNSGLLIRWDGNGNRVQEFSLRPCAVLCFCTHGTRLWVGYASGVVQLLDLEGNIISTWVSHNSPVVKMVTGGGYVFSMATHGGIRAWSITSPGPIDDIIRTDLAAKEALYTRREDFKILVGTWNVGQGKASPGALKTWLGSAVSDVEIVVVGCQEVEMGAGFLAMSAAKETVGVEGSAIGQWWQDAIGKAIDERTKFDRVGSRQLAGLLIAIWVKKDLRPYVGDLDVAAVACGFGRTIGNKGGVGLRLRVHDRILCFVNCHLAAHLEAVNRRNADFDHIYRTMVFTRQSHLLNVAAAGVSSASLAIKTSHSGNVHPDEGRPDLSEADMVIFFGDFNYRLFGISYDEARDFVSQRSFDWLREKDQLREEMKAGKVFQGMREAVIRFPPTYKFERNQAGLGGYDSGEKKRIPAWCDRIIYRDSRHGPVSDCSLDCPIVSSILMYEACIDVIDSDHKPVRCKFSVRLARVDRSVRRKEFGKVMNSNEQIKIILDEYSVVPKTKISTKSVVLQNQETSSLTITNKSVMDAAIFNVICEGQCSINDDGHASDPKPRACFGFPSWLEVQPATGIIKPSEAVVITIRHTEFHTLGDLVDGIPQNWRSEETRDKEVVLRINVGSTCSTEPKTHHVRVRLCCSSETIRVVSRSNSSTSRRGNSNSRQSRSETDKLDNGSDKVDRG